MTSVMEACSSATHYEPFTNAFYKRINGEWYIYSRIGTEPMHWVRSVGTCAKCLCSISEHPSQAQKEREYSHGL